MNWEKVKLSDLCFMNSGGTPRRGVDGYYGGNIPWAKISDIENSNGYISETEEKITQAGLNSINNRIFPAGTMFLAMYGSVGKVTISTREMSTNQAILGIRPKQNGTIDLKFLKYWFETIKERLIHRAVGGTLQNISLSIVKDLEVALPSFPTQQKIAAILDAADNLRRKDKELLAKYDSLLQSVFYHLFGDPVRNDKGWDVKLLKDCTAFLTSGSRGWAKYYADHGDIFLRINNVGKNQLKLDNLAFVNAPDTAETKRIRVREGDLLFSITADLGRTAVIPEKFPTAYINQHLCLIRLKEGYNPNYVAEFIGSEGGKVQIANANKGGVKAGLNFSDINSLKILNPPIELQNHFSSVAQNIRHQKQQVQKQFQQSEALFQSLLQKAFKGQLVK